MAPELRVLAVLALLVGTETLAHLDETIYAVAVSSQMRGGEQESLCAHVHGATEPITLTITLNLDLRSHLLVMEKMQQDFYLCQRFQVPQVRTNTVAAMNVTVEGESGSSFSKKTSVLIRPPSFIHVVQTDKPIYKPGQTVQFRMVSLDTNFIPVQREYKVVELQDPMSMRIAQWLNQSVSSGILDLSHPMIPEAMAGSYRISATTDRGEEISHSFEIKEYVLPKYEVKLHLPSVITVLDKEATIRVCGKYTYGKPAVGSVTIEVRRNPLSHYWLSLAIRPGIHRKYHVTTDKSGCASQVIQLSEYANKDLLNYGALEVSADLQEHGTGVTLRGSGSVAFTNRIKTLRFEDSPVSYKPGIPLEGKVKAVGPSRSPLANETVHVFSGDKRTATVTTDRNGLAAFTLDTSDWTTKDVTLRASFTLEGDPYHFDEFSSQPTYGSDNLNVAQFYSKSKSFLKLKQVSGKLPCEREAPVRAQYIIQGAELKKEQEVLHFFYLVMSRGGMVQHGRIPVAVKEGTVNQGEVTVTLRQLTDLAPFAQVVVYTMLPGGETVADSMSFPIQLCLHNKVSLKFSAPEQLPAENTTLKLLAHPGSLCSVRAVDQSVLLLKSQEELTVDYVYGRLPEQQLTGYPPEVGDVDPCIHRFHYEPDFYHQSPDKDDVHSVFKAIGIKIVTNSDVRKPDICPEEVAYAMFSEFDGESDVYYTSMRAPVSRGRVQERVQAQVQKEETVRTFFPETWIWDLVSVGDEGSVALQKTVPDTVTKWAAGAFCISSVGFGVSPSTVLTAFQPFFVSLTLPYSVIRGEVFTLKATVFNYLSKCIMVNVTLAQSEQFFYRTCDGCQYSVCLCGEESRTFMWTVTPSALGQLSLKVSAEALRTDVLCGNEVATVPEAGRIDTVVRTLLVEAEGTPQSVSHNVLLCPSEGPVEKTVSVLMPEMFVAGSARATVSVLGDLMGRATKNLDKLLAMPYGCGEQNMLLFAPNIYILNYLKSTNQLTQEVLHRATRFLESGYQRELTYRHDDGSYSAFGKSDASGNTWLTAFVMKSFGGARPYIFVDQEHVDAARRWLAAHQRADGCVRSVGKLFHNEMKGGVSDDESLTAYITAALLELDSNATGPVISKCLSCLRSAAGKSLSNLYTTALLSYTFTLAGDQEMRSRLVTYLHQRSDSTDGTRHWSRAGASKKGLDSLEVEMTSYVLLALLSGPPLPQFGLDYASGIMRWLTQQQNPYGGFSSTQDTVVALQALSKYGAATYSEEGGTTVAVTSLGGLKKEFAVDQSNRLLYQEQRLSDVPGEYTVRAEGKSCVLSQISLHYNIPPPPDFSAFNITTSTMAKCGSSPPQLILFVHVRYQGPREETNMVILNIKLLSGYVLDKSSLGLLKTDGSVKRVDVDEGFINIYLDGLKKGPTAAYSVTLEEDVPVRNLKPAVVKVYDYYRTSDAAVTDYTSPCAESDRVAPL
ncbi:alpha-2-macroglobulin [Neosynchiropus ocellatus]